MKRVAIMLAGDVNALFSIFIADKARNTCTCTCEAYMMMLLQLSKRSYRDLSEIIDVISGEFQRFFTSRF